MKISFEFGVYAVTKYSQNYYNNPYMLTPYLSSFGAKDTEKLFFGYLKGK